MRKKERKRELESGRGSDIRFGGKEIGCVQNCVTTRNIVIVQRVLRVLARAIFFLSAWTHHPLMFPSAPIRRLRYSFVSASLPNYLFIFSPHLLSFALPSIYNSPSVLIIVGHKFNDYIFFLA